MDKRDFRKLDAVTQAELRRVAVRMVQAGKTRREAATAVEVNPRFVGTWVTAVERSGEAALAGGRRGRRPDEQKALSPEQETRIKCLITGKCPDALDLPCALWTRKAVGLLIERETDLRLSRSTIGSYLRNWGFTPQRPRKRATERHEPAVQAWLDRDYPAIVKRAKAEGADIHWGDETGVSNQANYGRSFAPKGQTPVIARPATRFSCSMTPIVFRWDHGGASAHRQIAANGVSIERLVGDDAGAFNGSQQGLGQNAVVSLARGEEDADDLLRCRTHRRTNLGRQPATRAANIFVRTAARARGTAMSLANGPVQHQRLDLFDRHRRLKQPLPYPSFAPSAEALAHRIGFAKRLR